MLETASQGATLVSREKRGHLRRRWLTALLMVAPFLLIYLVFLIYPSLRVLQLSLTNADLTGQGQYIGLSNYTRLLREPTFRLRRYVGPRPEDAPPIVLVPPLTCNAPPTSR